MIKELRLIYYVSLLCRVLEVTTSGCYAWVKRPFSMLLDWFGMRASMSRKGNCYDNVPMESFRGMLKNEQIHHCRYTTRQEAIQDITEYIEIFYNRQRRQARLGFLSPATFERWFYEKRLAA